MIIATSEFDKEINLIIANAIREDVGAGDHSSLACIPSDAVGKAKLLIKEDGVISGVEFAKRVFNYVDPGLKMEILIEDGNLVKSGDICFYVAGNSQSILKSERLILNAMQRMSAISTKTKHYVDLLKETSTKILDTRKTTPGIRALEKWAVKIGGGENHRFALYDMVMLKDNHIDFCGGITKALKKATAYKEKNNLEVDIIVEARNNKEVLEILEMNASVRRILLDNFTIEETLKAVQLIGSKCETESSGNITEKTILEYANCGINYISVGALTHSVYNMDLSLKAF